MYSLVHKDEVTNAEFRELQLQTWHKFYSNLIQYQEVHMEPLGLVDGRGSMPIALIRKVQSYDTIMSNMAPVNIPVNTDVWLRLNDVTSGCH